MPPPLPQHEDNQSNQSEGEEGEPYSNRRPVPLLLRTKSIQQKQKQKHCSTIYSDSTSCTDLSSPAVSSRVLYHDSFGRRPATSKSLPAPREERRRRLSFGDGGGKREGKGSHHYTNSADNNNHIMRTKTMGGEGYLCGGNIRYREEMQKKEMMGMMTSEEEFDALPIAVRRKFFSTLERLRFAQTGSAPLVNNTEYHHHFNQKGERPNTHSSSNLAERRGVSRRVSLLNTNRHSASISHITNKPRRLRKQHNHYPDHSKSLSSPDSPDSPRTWFMTLPEKIQQSQFSREEQIALAGRLKEGRGARGRESVVLDAADEAIWKASFHRQNTRSRRSEVLRGSPLPESLRSSMESLKMMEKSANEVVVEKGTEGYNAYDSFRWMDEESDLDLRLNDHLQDKHLDDYHANLPDAVPLALSKTRPSFRRHLSISKLPFGGNANIPDSSSTWAAPPNKGHETRRSRALSLLPAARHPPPTPQAEAAYDDPNATYWQDPDARLKLRVFLASPQKFDEAIEFGFPSSDAPLPENEENRPPLSSKDSRFRHVGDGSHGTATSFLNDDDELIFGDEDDASMIDPDSPKTPQETVDTYNLAHHRSNTSQPTSHMRFASKSSSSQSGSARASRERSREERDYSHLGITKPTFHKRADTDGFLGMALSGDGRHGYMTQVHGSGNREMTLRMTLTRPDLRTDVPPPVPEKDRQREKVGTHFTGHRTERSGSVDRLGGGTGGLGWQHAITQTTITAGKPSFSTEKEGEKEWEDRVEGVRGPFGGHDGWGPEKGDGSVVKRFWNRVKSQKRV